LEMIFIAGMGWLDSEGYGAVGTGLEETFGPGADPGGSGLLQARWSALKSAGIIKREFRNLGRLDEASRSLCYAVGLAVMDAGLDYPLAPEITAGIVGTDSRGCLDADLRYFSDYLDSDRTLGRGNYFIYTLPSSSVGEASIHFGLQGASLYINSSGDGLQEALLTASGLISHGDEDMMFVGATEPGVALCLIVSGAGGLEDREICTLDDALREVGHGIKGLHKRIKDLGRHEDVRTVK
jgi:3-oxoacyl-(acyl-carrier-protein) synthase